MSIGFDHVRYGSIYTPTYSTGQIGFFVAHVTAGDEDSGIGTCTNKDEECDIENDGNDDKDGNDSINDNMNTLSCSKGKRTAARGGNGVDDDNDDDIDDFLDYGKMKTYFKLIKGGTQYYYPKLHASSFDLPFWVQTFIYSKDLDP